MTQDELRDGAVKPDVTVPYEPGRAYALQSVADVAQLLALLPLDRRRVFQREINAWIDSIGTEYVALLAVGMSFRDDRPPLIWLDDDERRVAAYVLNGPGEAS